MKGFRTVCAVTLFAVASVLTALPAQWGFAADSTVTGEWVLGESTGVIKDVSGNGSDGKIVGNASWVDTPFGRTLHFDGKTYVEIPHTPAIANDADTVSVEIVLQPDEENQMPVLIKGLGFGGYAVLLGKGGLYHTIIIPWNYFYGGKIPARKPEQLVFTFQKPVVKMYVGGKPVSTGNLDKSLSPDAGKRSLLIGAFENRDEKTGVYNITPGFKGWIMSVKIYKKALTDVEVKSRYDALFPAAR